MDKIKERMNALRVEADEAHDQVEELKAKVKALEQENLSKEQEITSLNHRNQLLEEEVEKLESSVKDAKDAAEDAGDDVKDRAKDRAKDARDDAKDVAKDAKAGSKQARKFDAEKVQPADLGLSLKDADDGIAISSVEKNSAFVDAGFRSGDQIVSVNGQNVTAQNDFVRYLFASNAVSSGRVPVIVMRGGARQTVYVQPATIIRNYETVVYQGRSNPGRDFGLVVDGRNDDRVYVERVIKDSRADQAGIQVDDEILAVNEQQVETRNDLARLLEKYEAERIDMEVRRDREAQLIEVKVLR